MENFEKNQEQSKLNVIDGKNGDKFYLSGLSEETLLDIAISICKKLNRSETSYGEKEKELLLSGGEIIINAYFSITYDAEKKEICASSEKSRGNFDIAEKLKEVVYSILREYNQ